MTVSADDFKECDIAYVKEHSLPVTEKPFAGGSKILVHPGARVTILEPYVNGKDKTGDNFHKIQLADGTVGYVMAYVSRKDTLEPAETAEKKDGRKCNVRSQQISAHDKYGCSLRLHIRRKLGTKRKGLRLKKISSRRMENARTPRIIAACRYGGNSRW